ncbi:GLPGLI family protein [Lacinutrix sp. WUR7]|uniref:GLPGLI family protein n=1 Tax=Lacinutrix sp. WUR7 TaxID=2653681 RepID=UPI00193DFF7A|nr:GLPGLI family protein [Lacinutrix sp. WUR7]QRM89188.1 GLPGLI family protein [Lacinutrix sp. WUR7]
MTFRNTCILFLLMVFSKSVLAQDFKGIATYKSYRKIDLQSNDNQSDAVQKQIQEQLQKQMQRAYTLTFTRNESIYKENEKLATPAPSSGGIKITVESSLDVLYKNMKANRYVEESDIFDKQFLVKDSLKNYNWKLVNETKSIGEYTCYKATISEEVEKKSFIDGSLETVKEERITTAWYTPQIPVNNGPQDFHGLPGLILEINDGTLTLICSKIIMNPKESLEIKEPKKGKVVSQEKFDAIMKKKNKEMMDRMQSRKKDGSNVIIIGG